MQLLSARPNFKPIQHAPPQCAPTFAPTFAAVAPTQHANFRSADAELEFADALSGKYADAVAPSRQCVHPHAVPAEAVAFVSRALSPKHAIANVRPAGCAVAIAPSGKHAVANARGGGGCLCPKGRSANDVSAIRALPIHIRR